MPAEDGRLQGKSHCPLPQNINLTLTCIVIVKKKVCKKILEAQLIADFLENDALGSIETQRLIIGVEHIHTLQSSHNLIDLYEAWNKPEETEEWQAKLPQTEAVEQ